jgi:hypothetical protein
VHRRLRHRGRERHGRAEPRRGAAFGVLTYALYTGAFWAIGARPWPEMQLSFVFLASITASIGMVWFTIAVT